MNEDKVWSVQASQDGAQVFQDSCKKRNMAHKKSIGLPLAILLLSSFGAAGAQAPNSQPANEGLSAGTPASRLAGDWRSSGAVTIAASKPPVVPYSVPATVLGVAPSGMRLDRMILLLEPSAAQQQALAGLLAARQKSALPANQRQLTPAAFAAAYSNSPSDVAAVVDWLRNAGFLVAPLPAGLGWVEFSGTAAQVEQAFQAQVKLVAIGSGPRAVLASAISVPAALRPVIHGLVSLDGVLATPALTTPLPVTATAQELAAETSLSHTEAATPKLMAQLLHLDALHASGVAGAGESIAIAARSNVRTADIEAFRSAFALPASPLKVVPDGADPGRTSDEATVAMTASWAGAAAPGAQIVLVPAASTAATDGLDLSLAAIVDQALAHTVTVGYSACEQELSEAHQAFYAAVYRQAAAEGIAVIAAAGDSGSAACHTAGSDARVTSGYGVNALASTPWNTAVGVAAFGSGGAAAGAAGLSAWSPVNTADPGYAGGGGASTRHAAPSWQTTRAIAGASAGLNEQASAIQELKDAGLSTGYRLLPDLALPVAQDSVANRGLAFCLSGAAVASGCNLVRAGGSSAAAAVFSGIAALVAEKYGVQGNMAPNLYALGGTEGVFSDVQQGNAQLACAAGSPGCGATERIGFTAGAGYDLATGLGSVNAQELVNKWPRPMATGTNPVDIILSVDNPSSNLTYNPQATVTLRATVSDPAGLGTPTGTVTFFNTSTNAPLPINGSNTLSNGEVTMTYQGVFQLNANEIIVQYSGDNTYGAATSTTSNNPQGPVDITISKSTTFLSVAPSAGSAAIGSTVPVVVTLTVGNPPAGNVAPTGNVTLVVDGIAISPSAPLTTVGGVSSATIAWVVPNNTTRPHEISATYPGDANYSTASPAISVPVAVTQGTTTTSLAVTGTPALGQQTTTWTLTATVVPSGSTPTVTGTVTFYDGGTQLGVPVTVSATSSGYAAVLSIPLANSVSHNITAVYAGDANWAASTSNVVPIAAVTLSDYVVLTASNLPVSSTTGFPTASPGQAVILAATVTPTVIPSVTAAEQYPTGYVDFYLVNSTGNALLGRVLLVRAGITDAAVANFTTATLPGGTVTLVAVYEGDLYYSQGISNFLTLGIQDFTLTPDPSNPGTNLDIVQGSSGVATYDVTGLGGFNGQIQVVCAVPSTDLPMTCTASPQQLVPNGTVTFVVQTFDTGAATGFNRTPGQWWPRAAGGTALGLLGFFLLPMRRRACIFAGKGSRRFLVLLLLLIGLGGAGIGCNSVTLGGTASASGGTPLGVATLKITASEYVNNTVFSRSVYLTVNVLVKPGA
jgi:hypothetical protein